MELVKDIAEELKSSYIDYAMSVIVGRAIPDVRDGLKPVQRRILYSMYEMGLRHDRPYVKCARVVGHVLGHYHPHGDAPVYEALVRMAQDFVMRYPLVDGQGNFGSIDGDEPAAMRYTECRLTRIAEEMLEDIEKDTVDFQPNFDATMKEPTVLPAKLPNLLVNGSSGIAVGMATNIPPHNLSEVCEGIIAYIKNPNITVDELMEIIKGPDFPTGGIIVGRKGIKDAYETGKGRIIVRGRVELEGGCIVIREIPYMVNKAKLVERIANLIKNGKLEAKTVRDESDREGIRIVIELKSGANLKETLKKLYAHTPLQTTFSIINLALVKGEPRVLSLKEMIACYVEHRREVIRRRTEFELKKALERLHIVEGLKKAVDRLDEVVSVIRRSKSPSDAKRVLIKNFGLSERQADAVLQMRLQKLTSIEIESIVKEHEELRRRVEELESVLRDRGRIDEIIVEELRELKRMYGDRRRTAIVEREEEIEIGRERCFVAFSNGNFCKFDLRGRGMVSFAVSCRNDQMLLMFSSAGKAYWVRVRDIPRDWTPVERFVGISEGERIVSAVPVDEFSKEEFVVLLTVDGYIKKTRLAEFANAKRAGIIATTGRLAVARMYRDGFVVIGTKAGYVVRFKSEEIPEKGRNARGVKAVNLRGDDEVAWMTIGTGKEVLILTSDGYGKRTDVEEFRLTGRGAMGVIGGKGTIAFIELVNGDEEVAIFDRTGRVIRLPVSKIPKIPRTKRGFRLCEGISSALIF